MSTGLLQKLLNSLNQDKLFPWACDQCMDIWIRQGISNI